MLFEEQIARKPDLYPWTNSFIEKIWETPWAPTEFKFTADYGHFKTELTDQEREMVVRTLSAIGQVEIDVKMFWGLLGQTFRHPSIIDLGFEMAHTEVIHNKAYERLLEKLGLEAVFAKNLEEGVVKDRVDYLKKHLKRVYESDRKHFLYRLILFTLFVENVSLFSQFYVMLWLNRVRNVLPDVAQQIQYTRNEEMLHAQVGIKLINTLRVEYPELFDEELEKRVAKECKDAFKAESKIVDWMVGDYHGIGVQGERLDAETLKTFIKARIDDSMKAIGFQPQFVDSIDYELLDKTFWMDQEALGNNQTDFFHKRPVEYAKNNKEYKPGILRRNKNKNG